MSANRPTWIAAELMRILGLDDETVKQVIIPDLEGYTNETTLKRHLQDFLGPSPQAKAFSTRYLSLKFPSLPAQPIQTRVPLISKASHLPPSKQPTKSKKPSKANTPTTSQSQPPTSIPEALNTAFGPGGKIYQKNREADASSGWGSAKPAISPGAGYLTPNSVPMGGGASGSGGGHPRLPQTRMGGALTINEKVKAVKMRIDNDVLNGNSGGNSGKKGKEKEKIWDIPKSQEVKRLEGIMDDLRTLQAGDGKVERGDKEIVECFCQARVHPLAPYTPHCSHCGLVLCTLQAAHIPCPSCRHPLLSPPQLSRLLLRVQKDIETVQAEEQAKRDARERERLERLKAESGGGAFPVLPGGQSHPANTSGKSTPGEQGRKVLTLGGRGNGKGKGKAVLTTTYTRSIPTSTSGTSTPTPTVPMDLVSRPRSPPLDSKKLQKEWEKVVNFRLESDRPWGDLRADKKGETWVYVESRVVEILGEGGGRRSNARKKKRGGGIGVDGKVVVGAR